MNVKYELRDYVDEYSMHEDIEFAKATIDINPGLLERFSGEQPLTPLLRQHIERYIAR